MAFLYGRAGRLTSQNGGFRPGQARDASEAANAQRIASKAHTLLAMPDPEPFVRGLDHRLANEICTGLAQSSQFDPAVSLKTPTRALELTHILGNPVQFSFVGFPYEGPPGSGSGLRAQARNQGGGGLW